MANNNWFENMLSGAASGGIMGGGLPGALVGGGLGLLSSFIPERKSEQINPYTEKYYKWLSKQIPQYENSMKQYLAKSEGLDSEAKSLISQIAGTNVKSTFDPNAYFRQLMSQTPAYQKIANNALTPYANAESDAAKRLAAEAVRQTMDAMGAAGAGASGAAARAAAKGAATPIAQAAANVESLRAQLFGNLMNQGMSAAAASQEVEAQMNQAANQLKVQALNAALAGNLELANSYNQQAQLFASLLSGGTGAMGAMAEPVYETPENSTGFAALLGGAFGGMSGDRKRKDERKTDWDSFINRFRKTPKLTPLDRHSGVF